MTGRRLFGLLASLVMTSALAVPTRAADQVPYKATVHGFAILPPTPTADPDIVQIVVPLEGQGTRLGRFHEELTHFLNRQTGHFTGFAVFTAADGDTFMTQFYGQILGPTPDPEDDPAWVAFEVFHTIVSGSGTGRFAGVTGSFVGVGGRYNVLTGEDIAGYVGTISSPGASKK